MHIAGSRRIMAPPPRVRVALTDADFLATYLPHTLVGQASPGEPGADDGIVWKVDGGEAAFKLSHGQGDSTWIAYDAAGDDALGLKASIETFLDALQSAVAGPRETGAEGPLVAIADAAQSGFPFRPMPNLIFGMPLVFWCGSAVFFLIFVFMFSAYL